MFPLNLIPQESEIDLNLHSLDTPRLPEEVSKELQMAIEAYRPSRKVLVADAYQTATSLVVRFINYHCRNCMHDYENQSAISIPLPLPQDIQTWAQLLGAKERAAVETTAKLRQESLEARRTRAEILLARVLAKKWKDRLDPSTPLPSVPECPQDESDDGFWRVDPMLTYIVKALEENMP